MAGTTIFSTVDDVLDAAEIALQLEGIGGYRTLMLTWLNEGQLEIESALRKNGMTYEALRVSGQSGTDIGALAGGASDYAFVSRIAAIDLDSVRDSANSIRFRREEEIRHLWDRSWSLQGAIEFFSLRPNAFKFWRVPSTGYVATQPTIYFDYFTRFNKFTAETDPLTQYYEHDRLVLQKYLEYRGYQQADDTREDKAQGLFQELALALGSSGNVQGVGGPPTEAGLGAYFDPDYEW